MELHERVDAVNPSRMVLILAALTVCLIGARMPANATSYYVAPEGSDSNSGTSPDSPWRTLAKVNATSFQPGDSIHLLRGGLWRETLAPRSSGVKGQPVTFTAYGDGPKPIISGSDLVRGWRLYNSHNAIYSARLDAQPRNVYVDGLPGWGLQQVRRLDDMAPGNWLWRNSILFIRLEHGGSPSSHAIEAATRIYGVNINGQNSNNNGVGATNFTARDGTDDRNGMNPYLGTSNIGFITLDNLSIGRTAGYGIFFYSSDSPVIQNCKVFQTGTGQVDGGEYYNAIHVSISHAPRYYGNQISYAGGHGNAINSQGADQAQLIRNSADHFNHHGFDLKHSDQALVWGNIAHDSTEANGIYQEYSTDTYIEFNTVYNLTGSVPGRGSGIQVDVGSRGARIFNNTIYHVLSGIYLSVPAKVKNNVVNGCAGAVLEANGGGTFDYNDWGVAPKIVYDDESLDFSRWQAMGGHSHDIASDPKWASPDAVPPDFHLLRSSPCLDAGKSVVWVVPRHGSGQGQSGNLEGFTNSSDIGAWGPR